MPVAVWGFNGVVAADVEAHLFAFNAILEQLGHKPLESVEEIREITRSPLVKSFEKLGIPLDGIDNSAMRKIDRLYQGTYLKHRSAYRRNEGVRRAMDWFAKNRWSSIMLSRTRRDILKMQLVGMNMSGYFTHISGEEDRLGSAFSKSDRLHDYLENRNRLALQDDFGMSSALPDNRGVIICDSAEEIEAARDNGFKSIAFTGGWVSRKRLEAANPDHIIDTLLDIPAIAAKNFAPVAMPPRKTPAATLSL